jgi:hypothetical protein
LIANGAHHPLKGQTARGVVSFLQLLPATVSVPRTAESLARKQA